jgi:predicted metal-dependent hydrolase
VQGFIGQEATHRRLHSLYNAHLEKLGLVNEWEAARRERLQLLEGLDVRHWLAITAANEHFTAILADFLLHNPDLLGDRDPRLATLWLWHSAEESEHKCTAFDLYQALGGSHEWRVKWMRASPPSSCWTRCARRSTTCSATAPCGSGAPGAARPATCSAGAGWCA